MWISGRDYTNGYPCSSAIDLWVRWCYGRDNSERIVSPQYE
jgi:hypothetical protein